LVGISLCICAALTIIGTVHVLVQVVLFSIVGCCIPLVLAISLSNFEFLRQQQQTTVQLIRISNYSYILGRDCICSFNTFLYLFNYQILSYVCSGTGETWTLYVHCKNGLPDMDYVTFKIERADIKLSTLTSLKDQLGYAFRDYLFYKKRCGRDVARLQPIDYMRDLERMLQDNDSEKEIRLVLSQENETAQQVRITPVKRPRQRLEEEEHPLEEEENPFMDDLFDAYKDWLKKLPQDQSKSMPSIFLHMYSYCLESQHRYIISNIFFLTNRFQG
jgi:hypothetical protein